VPLNTGNLKYLPHFDLNFLPCFQLFCKQMPGLLLKIGYDHVLLHNSRFVIYKELIVPVLGQVICECEHDSFSSGLFMDMVTNTPVP
jgi:hypothetical protein